MNPLHWPAVQRVLSRHLLCHVEGAGGRFALTFDDGPSPRNTPRLLDVLAHAGAQATFFLLAPHVLRHPDLVRRMVAAGHEPGIHGRIHLSPIVLPTRTLVAELRKTAAAIADAAEGRARFYRAPSGLLRPGQARSLRELGYTPVLGDIYPEDWRRTRPEPIVECVRARLAAGSIVILHDACERGDPDRGATIAAVETILREAAARGLRAATLSEMVAAAAKATS